jgi:hypothetical protein
LSGRSGELREMEPDPPVLPVWFFDESSDEPELISGGS